MKLRQEAYRLSVKAIVQDLETDSKSGLTKADATQRLRQWGENKIEFRHEKKLWVLFLEQFINPLVAVLGAAATLAFAFEEWLEGSAVLVVILINALIGFYMEWQARRSMEALRRLSQSVAKVYREGQLQSIHTDQIVIGDLLFLEAGDVVPADARIVQEHQLGIMEAALTGESDQVEKGRQKLNGSVLLADQRNMVFKGTTVTRGNAKALVVATGANTELGKIAHLTHHAEKEATPLEKKLSVLSRKLIWLTLFLAAIILVIGLLRGREFYLMMETAIAMAIAAIPEGLPIVATIALARGMLRLARHQVVVKRLSAVETLGETDVIFTDKTGTLTENKLTAEKVILPDLDTGQPEEVLLDHYQRLHNRVGFQQILQVGVLCNNASIMGKDPHKVVGDPLEVALLQMAKEVDVPAKNWRRQFPRVKEIPFDSDTKMMGTLHKDSSSGGFLVCIKGALEVILAESDYVLTEEGAIPVSALRQPWIDRANHLAAGGLRVLGLAYAHIAEPEDKFFHNLIFLGCIAFVDPPRTEVRPALQTCKKAGVKVIMVTGDHPETARNIALRTDLAEADATIVIHGQEIEAFEQIGEENRRMLLEANVFARVSPAQKLDLVRLYQEEGHTVGMTGDGINDAPALKKADIGIAMGSRGTEAAKEVADLVLENDAFSSIVVAIRQGRGIFQNIRYFVIYLLSCNLSEILVVSVSSLANFTLALLPLQILFLNMVTDVFPALALGSNEEPDNIMEQPPRSNREPIVTRQTWRLIILYALAISIACLGILYFSIYYLEVSASLANNLTFYTLILAQLWHLFNLPGAGQSFWNNEVTRNRYIWLAILICLLITLLVYFVPTFSAVLSLETIDWLLLSYAVGFSLIPVVLIQLFKRMRFF